MKSVVFFMKSYFQKVVIVWENLSFYVSWVTWLIWQPTQEFKTHCNHYTGDYLYYEYYYEDELQPQQPLPAQRPAAPQPKTAAPQPPAAASNVNIETIKEGLADQMPDYDIGNTFFQSP